MATRLATRLYNERFDLAPYTRPTAWQTLGHKSIRNLPAGTSVLDAFQQAELGYTIQKFTPQVVIPAGQPFAGQIIPLKEVALMREPTADDDCWREISTVGKKFGVIQQLDLARRLQPLADLFTMDSIGTYGLATFVTFKTGGYRIAGDEIERYLLVMNSNDGFRSLVIALIDVRMYCTNQMVAALDRSRAAGLRLTFPHHEHVERDVQVYMDLIQNIAHAQQQQQRAFEILAETRVTPEQAREIISAAYPMPGKTEKHLWLENQLQLAGYLEVSPQELLTAEEYLYEQRTERARIKQQACLERHEDLCGVNTRIARTAWSVLSAVAEVSDNLGGTNIRKAAAAVLFGDRGKERKRAFVRAWKIAGNPVLN